MLKSLIEKEQIEIKDYFRKKYGFKEDHASIIYHIILGCDNREVAEKLGLSTKGVKYHITNLYKKMKLKRRTQFILSVPSEIILKKVPAIEKVKLHSIVLPAKQKR